MAIVKWVAYLAARQQELAPASKLYLLGALIANADDGLYLGSIEAN